MNTGTARDTNVDRLHQEQLLEFFTQRSGPLVLIDRSQLEEENRAIESIDKEIQHAKAQHTKAVVRLETFNRDYHRILLGTDDPAILAKRNEVGMAKDQIAALESILSEKGQERLRLVASRDRILAEMNAAEETNLVSQQADAAKAEILTEILAIRDSLDRIRELSTGCDRRDVVMSDDNRAELQKITYNTGELFRLQILEYVRHDFSAFLRSTTFLPRSW
jgi:hypothetical protein